MRGLSPLSVAVALLLTLSGRMPRGPHGGHAAPLAPATGGWGSLPVTGLCSFCSEVLGLGLGGWQRALRRGQSSAAMTGCREKRSPKSSSSCVPGPGQVGEPGSRASSCAGRGRAGLACGSKGSHGAVEPAHVEQTQGLPLFPARMALTLRSFPACVLVEPGKPSWRAAPLQPSRGGGGSERFS